MQILPTVVSKWNKQQNDEDDDEKNHRKKDNHLHRRHSATKTTPATASSPHWSSSCFTSPMEIYVSPLQTFEDQRWQSAESGHSRRELSFSDGISLDENWIYVQRIEWLAFQSVAFAGWTDVRCLFWNEKRKENVCHLRNNDPTTVKDERIATANWSIVLCEPPLSLQLTICVVLFHSINNLIHRHKFKAAHNLMGPEGPKELEPRSRSTSHA